MTRQGSTRACPLGSITTATPVASKWTSSSNAPRVSTSSRSSQERRSRRIWTGPLERLAKAVNVAEPDHDINQRVVYGGSEATQRRGVPCIPWRALPDAGWL